jgi:hypothetical protein
MFWQILQEQSQRKYLGPISMFIKIFYPQIPLPFFDGWIVLGWLSAFWLILSPSALRRKKQGEVLSKTTDFQTTKLSYISIPITIHLFFFTLYGGDNFPWYMFIPYPLLALSTGIIIHRYIIKPNIYYNLIFYLIPFSSYWHYSHWTEKIDWRTILSQYRLSFIIFIIIPFFVYILKEKYTKLGQLHNSTIQISLHIMIFITLYLSIKTTNNMITIWLLLENLPYPLIWNR